MESAVFAIALVYQETLVILKPDALERNLVGAIIDRYEKAGLKIIDMH